MSGWETSQRAHHEGEACECGRPATVVLLTERFGPVPWCGISDGGRSRGR